MFQFFDHPKQSDQSSSTDETIPQQSSSKDEASSSKTSSRRRKNTSKTSSKGSSHRANAASPEINDPPSPKDKMEEESLDDPSIMDEEKHDKVSSDNTTTAMPSEGSSEDEFKVLSASEFLVTAGLSNEECGSATADIAPATARDYKGSHTRCTISATRVQCNCQSSNTGKCETAHTRLVFSLVVLFA